MAENNNKKKIELEENEIMRFSIKKSDTNPEGYELECLCNGDKSAMKQGLMQLCSEEFDMICIPKEAMMGIGICVGNPFASDEDDEDEEGEETKETVEESEE